MNDSSLKTLFHPYETGLIEPPGEGERVLFLNAAPGFRLPAGFSADLASTQDFRPGFLALKSAGHSVSPQPLDDGYDHALVLCGRHRGQNEMWIAQALKRVRPAGLILIAGGKTDGTASLRKRIATLLPVEDHASKHHGVVFWFKRPSSAGDVIAALEEPNRPLMLDAGFRTVPGLFSYDRIDAGSRLLADNLPTDLKGAAADLGAGWGYLSVKLTERASKITSVDLYEASFAACEAARANMAALAPDVTSQVLWHDLLSEKIERRYDVIVMNPPFHQGRAAEPSLGEGMIRAASAGLKAGGRLFLVANRPLPYEAILKTCFARSGETVRDDRFKILWAVR